MTVQAFDSDADRAKELGFHDNMLNDILIMGDKSLSIVGRDGHQLTSIDVPKTPTCRPAVGDFDSDGVSDVIVMTGDAVLGYRLEVTVGTRGMFVAVSILVTIAFIVYVSTIKISLKAIDGNAGGGPRQVRVFTSKRSTDEYHVD